MRSANGLDRAAEFPFPKLASAFRRKEYAYHATSAHWVMAEIVERLSGMDFRDFFRVRVAERWHSNLRMGLPRDQQYRQLN
jgi:CubicO group peptidase (beta-lactamase class C family)